MMERKVTDAQEDTSMSDDLVSTRAETIKDEEGGPSLRRSTRIRAKQESVFGFSPEPVSSRKRQKGKQEEKPMTKRRIKSIVGRLERLMDIPFDIFCLIASNLSPQDLLNMARANKALRSLLMSKESKPIWRASRESIGMPECPSDLSEPKYADLMFCKGCYICDSPRAQTLHFALRVRLCKSCSEKNVCPIYRVHGFEKLDESEESVFNMIPTQACVYRSASLCYIDEVRRIWLHYHSNDLSPEGRKQYAEERKILVEKIRENAIEVERWMARKRIQRSQEQNAIATAREQSIFDRLKEKGFNDMDLDATLDTGLLRSRWRKLVKDPKPLTERIWNNIEPQLRLLIAHRRQWRSQLGTALDSLPDYFDEDYSDNYHDDYYDNSYDWEDEYNMIPYVHLPYFGWTGDSVFDDSD